MRVRLLAAGATALLVTGCGAPSTVADQADLLGSTASEGELLAHDAAEGSTTDAFTRVHAHVLAEQAASVGEEPAAAAVGRLAARIEERLEQLADDPGDRRGAAQVERALGDAADRAHRLEEGA